jgi:hypothetical protein
MKLTVGAVLACFLLAIAFATTSAEAAGVEKAVTKTSLVGNNDGVTELGRPPNVPPVDPPGPPTTKPVKPPKPDKPPRSNKNDGDDGSDDGNAGGGNDDKPPKDKDKDE